MTTKKSYYKPTGYGRGRPRTGEIRPNTYGAVKSAQYRAAWKEADPEGYAEHHRQVSAEWRANNHERSNEISRNSHRRRAGWKNVTEKAMLNDLTVVAFVNQLKK